MLYYDIGTQKKYFRIAVLIALAIVFIPVVIVIAIIALSHRPADIQIDENGGFYKVVDVVDGDTIDIDYSGETKRIRLIGVDTPETKDSRVAVQCFGEEASNYLKKKLSGQQITIEADSTQADIDEYGRLLRYVYLNNEDIGLSIISNGYGHEYTYNIPYKKQSEYKAAQAKASEQNLGLWSPSTCNGDSTRAASASDNTVPVPPSETSTPNSTECLIKGNISNKGVKIYHVPGQQYYNETVITPSKGERYFCTEQEAIDAGWRKSKV